MSLYESQAELLSVLRLTTHEVKVFAFDSTAFIRVSPEAALAMAETGDYTGGGNPRRCRYIKSVTPPPSPDYRDLPDFRACDSGFSGFLSYPQASSDVSGRRSINRLYPALARDSAGL